MHATLYSMYLTLFVEKNRLPMALQRRMATKDLGKSKDKFSYKMCNARNTERAFLLEEFSKLYIPASD